MKDAQLVELFKATPYTIDNGGFEAGLRDWKAKNNVLERKISFSPAYDKRDPDPSKNYGIHSVDMYMAVIGDKGAIVFTVFTGWFLNSIDKSSWSAGMTRGTGASICYHSPMPTRENELPASDNCKYIGGKCYSDCTYTQADDLFNVLVEQGDEAVWQQLEERYKTTFT